jgi:hypothetical protein
VPDNPVERWSLDLDSAEAQASLREFSEKMTGAFTAGGMAVKGMELALEAMVDVIKTGWKEWQEAEKVLIRLDVTTKAFGASSGVTSEGVKVLSEHIGDMAGMCEMEVIQLANMAMAYGVTGDKLDDFTKATIELSNVTGRDLQTSMLSLIRAQDGHLDRMTKLVPALKGLTEEQLRNGDAVKAINEQYGEFLDLEKRGVTGQIKQMGLAWDDMSRALVGVAANSTILLAGLKGITSELRTMEEAFKSPLWQQYLAITGGLMTLPMTGVLGPLLGERFLGGGKQIAKSLKGNEDYVPDLVPLVHPDDGPTFDNLDVGKGVSVGKHKPDESMTYHYAADSWQTDKPDFGDAGDRAEKRAQLQIKFEKSMAAQVVDIDRKMYADLEKARDQDMKLQQQQWKEWGQNIAQGVGIGLEALELLATQGKDAAWRFVVDQVSAIGSRLFMKGTADMAEALFTLSNPITAGFAPGMIATAAEEMAVGGAMAAGGMVVKANSGSYDKSGGGGHSAGGSSSFAGSAGHSGNTSTEKAPEQITVNLNGPVYSGAEAGVAILEAIKVARRQGHT